jgi:hypothetical protein
MHRARAQPAEADVLLRWAIQIVQQYASDRERTAELALAVGPSTNPGGAAGGGAAGAAPSDGAASHHHHPGLHPHRGGRRQPTVTSAGLQRLREERQVRRVLELYGLRVED